MRLSGPLVTAFLTPSRFFEEMNRPKLELHDLVA